MLFVGIDQSLTHPGIAILNDEEKLVVSDVLSVGTKLRGSERLSAIGEFTRKRIEQAIEDQGLHSDLRGCIEGPSLGSIHREFDLGEVSGVVKSVCWMLGLDLIVVAPTQLKFFATGHGLHGNSQGNPRASKDAVLHAVKIYWSHDFGKDDNRADAYVLARIAWAMHHRKFKRRCEADVVVKLSGPSVPNALRRRRLDRATNI
jgi:hypothetical protein